VKIKTTIFRLNVVVVHICDPSYIGGGRTQKWEHQSLKPAWVKVSKTLVQKPSWAWWCMLVNLAKEE
jgi:hypothetical protein